MDRNLIGGLIQMSSSIMSIIGITLQRLTFIQDAEELQHHSRIFNKRWLFGFCLLYFSQLVEMLALAFASQTTIVAVSSCGTFLNPLVGVYFFHEPFHFRPPKRAKSLFNKLFRWDFLNLAITVAGSVCTLIYAPSLHQDVLRSFSSHELFEMWGQRPFVYFFGTCAVLVPSLLFHFFVIEGEDKQPLALTVALGTCQAYSITLTKIVTQLVENKLSFIDWRVMLMVTVWVCLLVLQVLLLQQGLARFEQSGTFSMCGMLGGALTITSEMLYYQTYVGMQHKYEFACGVGMMLYGILAFSQRHVLSPEEMKLRLNLEEALDEDEEEVEELFATSTTPLV